MLASFMLDGEQHFFRDVVEFIQVNLFACKHELDASTKSHRNELCNLEHRAPVACTSI